MITVPPSQYVQVHRARARRHSLQFGVTMALVFIVVGLLGRLGLLDALGSIGARERGPLTVSWVLTLLFGAAIGGFVGGSLLALILGGAGRSAT